MRSEMPAEEELSQRQQAAVFIHELGNHLKVYEFPRSSRRFVSPTSLFSDRIIV